MQVLVVSEPSAPAPRWAGANGRPFVLSRVPSVAAAVERLASGPPEVVVLDAAAAADADALERLRDEAGDTALLLRAEDKDPGVEEVLQRLGWWACLLPAGAPAPVQAQLVALAAERVRLAAALAERVADLEQRTRELEQSRARFRDIIERNADAILVVDRDGAIRFANQMAAELFATPREALAGTDFGFPLVAGEITELDLPHGAEPRVAEMRVVESEWEGRTAFIASLRDVTGRRRAEEDARRLIREQAARSAAEAAARRFRFLAEASTLLSLPLDYTETLATLARLCVRETADWAVVFIVDEDGAVQRLEVAHRDPARAEVVREMGEHRIGGSHPVLQVLRTGRPLLASRVDEAGLAALAQDERHLELIRQLGAASFMLVPLVARGRGLGAIKLVSADPARVFTDEDLATAHDLALRAALAVDNARLYREAQAANEAKSDLLAVISHDLRTPLNAIMGHAQLLEMGIPEPLGEGALERVERIRSGSAHLVYLIDQLLSFARLEAGREELRVVEADVCAVAREVAAVVEPLALERSLAFHLDLPDAPVALRTDPDRLRQVLLNLVGNAVKYTCEGEVRLELRSVADGGAEFRVRDTGVGILPEHLEKIFEPFWQVDPAQRAASGGTGLGLSVVRRLARLLGGDVTVESEPGRGSTFTV
ncbi:MAG TPA: PAS domain-containing sensor histidine kinase, partial [Longimicrobiaceae bacterium]